jgi:heat shock protein HslJ
MGVASVRCVRWYAGLVAILGNMSLVLAVQYADASEFPFGHELLLDARPMKGSKRVPILDVSENGAAVIDLWCDSVQGQVVVVQDTITILTGAKTERVCSPDRARGDEDMLNALQQVTTWRMNGDSVELIGPRTLRFRLPTN